MKKIICLTIILLSIVPFSNAALLGIEPLIGLTFSDLSYNPAFGSIYGTIGSTAGFIGGVGFDANFSGPGFEVDLLYAQKGDVLANSAGLLYLAQLDGTSVSKDIYTLNYLEIPILVKYNINLGFGTGFIGVGPEFDILLSANDITDTAGATTTDDKSGVKSSDIGLAISLGIEVSSLVIDLRYTLGLTDVNKGALDSLDLNGNPVPEAVKNNVFSVMIGYKFAL